MQISSGDIICFPGSGLCHGCIRFWTWGKYAHIATAGIDGYWESTSMSPYPCEIRKTKVNGVQWHSLGTLPDNVDVYTPTKPLTREDHFATRVWCNERLLRRYDYIDAIRARNWLLGWLFRVMGCSRGDHTEFQCAEFCGELVKQVYGLLDEDVNTSRLSPWLLICILVETGAYRLKESHESLLSTSTDL